jgi:AraC-like DNA-binding protein
MRSKRKLNLGAVSLVRGRVKGDIPIASMVRDEVEALLDSEFFEDAPFDSIGLIIRYGSKTNLSPEYQPIENGELPVAIEVSMESLRKAKNDELARIFRWALLEALLAIAEKYRLHDARLLTEKQKTYGNGGADVVLETPHKYLN